MKKIFFLITFFLTIFSSYSQDRKSFDAYRTEKAPKLDGFLNDEEWKNVQKLTDFSLWRPQTRSGKEISKQYKTTAFFMYDDEAVYVGAYLLHPGDIPMELSERDNPWDSFSELFFVSIDTYNDKENHHGFGITSAGAIVDGLWSGDWNSGGRDYDTVFEGEIQITKDGWSLEMKIPYSALRFPEKNIQNWGINFSRAVADLEEWYSWSPVDTKIYKWYESLGTVKGLKNIEPPLRLFLYPYGQTALNLKKTSSPSSIYSAGLDIKYGLSNSFTLDATLIPDFGQVSFDDEELNLSPFEQRFDENRAFFTEGANIFKKANGGFRGGDFFYSRRIGQEVRFDEDELLSSSEELVSYDNKPKLINAIKLSGTTNTKLSIGLLNAITGEANAIVRNIEDGSVRKETIAPVTNYNILSLTQQLLNDYSSIGVHNTNVNRGKGGYNSNNTAFVTELYDNKRNFNFSSRVYFSDSPRFSEKKGFRGSVSLAELKGNFRYSMGWFGTDEYYNQNELGYYNQQNSQRFYGRIQYQILNELKLLRSYSNYLFFGETKRYNTFKKVYNGMRFGNDFEFQNLYKLSIDFDYESEKKDYYETRNSDRFLIVPSNFDVQLEIRSDPTKKLTYGIEFSNIGYKNKQFDENKNYKRFEYNIDYRFSDKLSAGLRQQYKQTNDDVGYLQTSNNDIYLGLRNQKSIENSLDIDYRIDRDKSLSLDLRSFWSSADYKEVLYSLNENGYREMADFSLLESDPNTNFNIWNLDVKFQWWFSPGSNLIFLYRNQIFNRDNQSGLDYYKSLKNLFEIPIEHQISLRINYLIDVNRFRKK
tara:strand:+ start:1035 stop:3485 length:2451 start_codon:yes stop_codon:yes gene_type:complete